MLRKEHFDFVRMACAAFLIGCAGAACTNPGSGGPTAGDPDCDEAAVMSSGGAGQIPTPILPPGATDIEGPEDVDQDNGLISVLYPGLDTTTDAFYPDLPCDPSIGGGPTTGRSSADAGRDRRGRLSGRLRG